jgi:hypothetical protein
MVTPTAAQVAAACAAARKAINDYSPFYGSMVPDDALERVVTAALAAALGASPHPDPSIQQHTKGS